MSFLTYLNTLSKGNPSLKYGLFVLAYMNLVRRLRYRRINSLLRKYPDPTLPLRDPNVAKEVSTATSGYDFPFVNVVSLEFALFKTYAIPSISKILAATQQFATQCPKRADDTGLILGEMTEPYKRQTFRRMTEGKEDLAEDLTDEKRARLALEKLNIIHGHYPIRQEDYLYTLALFILEPVSWINRLEWRQVTDLEKNVRNSFLCRCCSNFFLLPERTTGVAPINDFHIQFLDSTIVHIAMYVHPSRKGGTSSRCRCASYSPRVVWRAKTEPDQLTTLFFLSITNHAWTLGLAGYLDISRPKHEDRKHPQNL